MNLISYDYHPVLLQTLELGMKIEGSKSINGNGTRGSASNCCPSRVAAAELAFCVKRAVGLWRMKATGGVVMRHFIPRLLFLKNQA